jgi:hypothetical protein
MTSRTVLLLLLAPVEATSSAPSILRCSVVLSTPTSLFLRCLCSKHTTHRLTTIRPSLRNLRNLRTTCLATPSMIPGGLQTNILLLLHPLRVPLLPSTMELRELGPRSRDTRVAPCSGFHPCLSPVPNPSNSSHPTTARLHTPPSTTLLSGTNMAQIATAVTVPSATHRTSWRLVMDLRLLPSNCSHFCGSSSLKIVSLPLFYTTYLTFDLRLSDSSIQKSLFLSAKYPRFVAAAYHLIRSGHWIHGWPTLRFESSLRPFDLDPPHHRAQNRSIHFAICTHIGATPDLTKTHKAATILHDRFLWLFFWGLMFFCYSFWYHVLDTGLFMVFLGTLSEIGFLAFLSL